MKLDYLKTTLLNYWMNAQSDTLGQVPEITIDQNTKSASFRSQTFKSAYLSILKSERRFFSLIFIKAGKANLEADSNITLT